MTAQEDRVWPWLGSCDFAVTSGYISPAGQMRTLSQACAIVDVAVTVKVAEDWKSQPTEQNYG